ncbi:MAG: tRNA (adenosine(37)-N6)-threonylcarbamoyltransferase complex transferase subunit TsaD [Planctomycetota bacterium]|nr:tRNA (adenosine(37)-N6)-threonylcarbamoyltransferase complex transferase subunit TsaD [Planctomycetota bacterium]MDA1165461.1 tRNA (adenosine(37)-N6)-threonylcarbamoyltransferase complex transferase subunit TsaD [Planctomycetota bacterium]
MESIRSILALESSCDETAAAVIDSDLNVLSNVVASQYELHRDYGGVVPEIASRAHVRRLLPVIDESLKRASMKLSDLGAIAVATQPGLVGSLLVGLTAAKTLAMVLDVPLVAVNHIEAHIYACRMAAQQDTFPCIGFVVSGGHTNLYDCTSPVDLELIGSTIDDAAGEAFDKVAQILNVGFPGGPAIQKVAEQGDPKAIRFPRTFLKEDRLEFSFSGLKTAVLYTANGVPGSQKKPEPLTQQRIADIAASFQAAAVDVLVGKCQQALQQRGRDILCVGGGVAANALLRGQLGRMARRAGARLFVAPMSLCTDNAAMAAIAWESLRRGHVASLDLDVTPGLVRHRRSQKGSSA